MCLFVGLSAFYRPHDICPLCGAGSEWPRAAKPSRPGRPRASGQAHAQREHARMPYNFSTKKSYADAFQKQNRTRARMLSYYSLPSLRVFTFRIVLNRTSSLVGADLGQLVNDINREKSVGSIPSTKKPNRNNQCTGGISRQLRVKAPTLSTGSSLSPSIAAAV